MRWTPSKAAIKQSGAILLAVATCATGFSAKAQDHSRPEGVDAFTQIFTKDNFEGLCLKTSPRTVSRYALAQMIVQDLKVPLELLKSANPKGTPSGGDADAPIPAENYVTYVSSETPFGENRDVHAKDTEGDYRKLLATRSNLQTWFSSANELEPPLLYKVVSTKPGPIYAFEFFADNSPVKIVCVEPKKPPTMADGAKERPQAPTTPLKNWTENIIVRKSVADIQVPSNKIAKANAAIFSYTENNEDDSKSYTIDGLIGLTIAGTGADTIDRATYARETGGTQPYYWVKLTPYLYGKRYNRTPDSLANKDIDLMQPGFAGNMTWVSANGGFAFDLLADGSWTNDIAQDASFYNTSLTFSPSIQIGNTILFNAPLFFGPIGLRPNVGFILREYYIEDAGTSPQLQNKSSFTSYGIDTSLKLFVVTKLKYLSELEARLRYLYLENTNHVVSVPRFEAGLSLAPAGLQNVTLDLSYVDGRDETTLQEEERWTAGVGVRF